MDKEKIVGFVTDVGGRTSHTAILARSMGIPAVVGLENVTTLLPGGVPVIVDGSAGTLILKPSKATFKDVITSYSIHYTKLYERIVNVAISNTFGFGGHNTSVVFKKFKE